MTPKIQEKLLKWELFSLNQVHSFFFFFIQRSTALLMQNFVQISHNILNFFPHKIIKEQCSKARILLLLVVLHLSINRGLLWIIFVNYAKVRRAYSIILCPDNFLCTDFEGGCVDIRNKRLRKSPLRGCLYVSFWFNHLGTSTKNTLQTSGLAHTHGLLLLEGRIPGTCSPTLRGQYQTCKEPGRTLDVSGSHFPHAQTQAQIAIHGIAKSIAFFQILPSSHAAILQPYFPVSESSGTSILFEAILN